MTDETPWQLSSSLPNEELLENNEIADELVGCPIEALPSDVLELIFLECHGPFKRVQSALDMKAFPWISAQMWNDLYLKFTWNGEGTPVLIDGIPPSQYSTVIMQERLLRCGGIPLTICIKFVGIGAPVKGDEVEKLIAIIGAHSEQWQAAELDIWDQSLTLSLFNQINDHLPRLEKLKWNCSPRTLPNVVVAPRLYSLGVHPASLTSFFPWHQLTAITLTADDEQTLVQLRILQKSEKLEQLTLFTTDNSVQHELKFKHLRVLCSTIAPLDLFLELPSLEVLDVKWPGGKFSPLRTFINRSSPSLKSLSLPMIFSEPDLRLVIDVLDMLPGLQKFSFYFNKAIVKHLLVDPNRSEGVALPNLRHLCLHSVPTGRMKLSCVELIESRFSADHNFARLESAEWNDSGESLDKAPKTHGRLVAMQRRGLQLTLQFDHSLRFSKWHGDETTDSEEE
ncbi:hypothetical protein C8J56DRAFT_881516 [Mycena floridula]|nr:hypothetical protein C8J56DRAFT_881516 [Mycena floridula]